MRWFLPDTWDGGTRVMNTQFLAEWQRIEYDNTPVYVRSDGPDWFVPNQVADQAFIEGIRGGDMPPAMVNLVKRIDGPSAEAYTSRSEPLKLTSLKECWIHITNQCNMTCGHCMFRSSPRAGDSLSPADCERIIHEAHALGCRLFFITGGEPLVSNAFFKSVQDILERADTHVVVLTNLSLISQAKDRLLAFPRDRLHFQVSLDGLQATHDAPEGGRGLRSIRQRSNDASGAWLSGDPFHDGYRPEC